MEKNTISPDQNLDNGNIFEDFAEDDSLGKEIEHHEKKAKKDIYHYLKITSGILKITNAILVLIVGVFLAYSFIQNNTTNKNYSILEPICNLFLGDVAEKISGCYSVSYYLDKVSQELETKKVVQTEKISTLIGDIYLVDNFIYSKLVSFLINTSNSRLQPVKILSEFDALKNKYEPIDKSKISCSNITINQPGILEARCQAFSSDWDRQIQEISEDGTLTSNNTGGTSISIASAFIDFLENDPESNFSVLEKQKVFFAAGVTGKGLSTKVTPFTIKLQYNNSQSINF